MPKTRVSLTDRNLRTRKKVSDIENVVQQSFSIFLVPQPSLCLKIFYDPPSLFTRLNINSKIKICLPTII